MHYMRKRKRDEMNSSQSVCQPTGDFRREETGLLDGKREGKVMRPQQWQISLTGRHDMELSPDAIQLHWIRYKKAGEEVEKRLNIQIK